MLYGFQFIVELADALPYQSPYWYGTLAGTS